MLPITAHGQESAAYEPARHAAYERAPAAYELAGTGVPLESLEQSFLRAAPALRSAAQIRHDKSSSIAGLHSNEIPAIPDDDDDDDESKTRTQPHVVNGQLQRPARASPTPLFISASGAAYQQPLSSTPTTPPATNQGGGNSTNSTPSVGPAQSGPNPTAPPASQVVVTAVVVTTHPSMGQHKASHLSNVSWLS